MQRSQGPWQSASPGGVRPGGITPTLDPRIPKPESLVQARAPGGVKQAAAAALAAGAPAAGAAQSGAAAAAAASSAATSAPLRHSSSTRRTSPDTAATCRIRVLRVDIIF